jgi:hypothetical protein
MDRSFLSQPQVITASRNFVCIRLTTYENSAEMRLLQSFGATGSGQVENTLVCVLSADGRRQLTEASRSLREVFGDADRMAQELDRIAKTSTVAGKQSEPTDLPKLDNVRLALDVAACDKHPLVVVFAADPSVRRTLERRLGQLAWNPALIGKLVYASTGKTTDFSIVEAAQPATGAVIVQPDRFGLKGAVLGRLAQSQSDEEWQAGLQSALARFQKSDDQFGQHVHDGRLERVFWKTSQPVTDPHEARARAETLREESGQRP